MKIFFELFEKLCVLIAGLMIVLSLSAELWFHHRPLLLHYQGQWHSPLFLGPMQAEQLGDEGVWEANYQNLAQRWREQKSGNFMIFPLVPYSPQSIDLKQPAPAPPHFSSRHFLGTDDTGRDVLSRLIYGLRSGLSLGFGFVLGSWSLALVFAGLAVLGGRTIDRLVSRLSEVWTMIPFLYIVVAATALLPYHPLLLILIFSLFSWPEPMRLFRAWLYEIIHRPYWQAAYQLGVPWQRLLPCYLAKALSPYLWSLLPFYLASSLITLTSLDFLGFGVPPPAPSWGELLRQGMERPEATWLFLPLLISLFVILTATRTLSEAIQNKRQGKRLESLF